MSLTQPTVTGSSAFWEMTGDKQPYIPTPVAQLGYRSPLEKRIAQLFKRNQFRDVRAAFAALIGAAAGGTATSTYSRVKAPLFPSASTPLPTFIGEMGGNRTIETQTVINRATTAADVLYLKQIVFSDRELEANMATVGYPADSSGVGGGGNLALNRDFF